MRSQITTTNSQYAAQTEIESNPLLKSLHDQVDLILQQPSGQNVGNIFLAVILAINKNLADPESPLSTSANLDYSRRINEIMRTDLNLTRTTTSSSSPESDERSLLPPPPESWSDSDLINSLIDQAVEAEKRTEMNLYSAYKEYR